MRFRAYSITDSAYKGSDAVVFKEISGIFYPVYCHESANWQLQMGDISQTSMLGFLNINTRFCTDFASRIIDELNKRGGDEIPQILQKIFGQKPEHV